MTCFISDLILNSILKYLDWMYSWRPSGHRRVLGPRNLVSHSMGSPMACRGATVSRFMKRKIRKELHEMFWSVHISVHASETMPYDTQRTVTVEN